MSAPAWWQSAVFYQIYPRSFLDTNGDGVGDLEGIRRKIPYLAGLGVDALWLSPFFTSPMADFGYDVADFCDVDPLFGSLADFDRMLADAHDNGLRVIIDFVPNHTSDRHPWFEDARSSRDAPHRDWYVWHDGFDGRPPNGWRAMFADEPAWTWDERTTQWYLRLFLAEQPDLDWSNPAVVEAMHDVLRFWLDRGVDGFRVDVAHLLGKDVPTGPDPSLLSLAPEPSPRTHDVMRGIRRVVDEYPDRMLVGEVYIMSTRRVAEFYGAGDELHLAFNFPPLYAPFEADAWRKRIERVVEEFDPRDAWPTWVLSNHDNARHRTRYRSDDRARAACLLLLGLRGSPFLYAGEELGLQDAVIPPHRAVDPAGRDGCRAPIPWEAGPAHGWASAAPWLPWPPGDDAAAQEASPLSCLSLYRRAREVRPASRAQRTGSFRWRDAPEGVLAWERADGAETRVVVINMTDAAVDLRT
ncbi:MAG: alpha-amylase family glycosyl hydrolase, partial [Acidimicrobiales bacterium]